MEILVIEDDKLKSDRLLGFLKKVYPDVIPKLERSYHNGLRRIEAESFDVILLDMTLPTYNASTSARIGRPRPLGGHDILRKMRRKTIRSKVIVVSALGGFGTGDAKFTFNELEEKCAEEFPDIFLGAVFFSQTSSKWERQLLGLLKKALEKRE
jgi:CheY-like chemotaxis protein